MNYKFVFLSILAFSFFLLTSCSPKSSQPCPHVYKLTKNSNHTALAQSFSVQEKQLK